MVETKSKILVALTSIFVMLLCGTIIYHYIEKWSFIDAFYFTGVTLTTVGYGDIHPVTDVGKLFTVFLAFMGIMVVFYSVSIVASIYFEKQQRTLEKRLAMLESRRAKERQKNSILERLRESTGFQNSKGMQWTA